MSQNEQEIKLAEFLTMHQQVEDGFQVYVASLQDELDHHKALLQEMRHSKHYKLAERYWRLRDWFKQLGGRAGPNHTAHPTQTPLPRLLATNNHTNVSVSGVTTTPDLPPIPPPSLTVRVINSEYPGDWFWKGGQITESNIRESLSNLGYKYDDFNDILDFGCGTGRVTYWIQRQTEQARLSGCDIDFEAIAWARHHLPGITFRVNTFLPPLPFLSQSFDLVIGISVFTHLDHDYQDAWLAELRRVTRPNSLLLLSVHGQYAWDETFRDAFRLERYQALFQERGFLFYKEDLWEHHFPDYYHTAFHLPQYIRQHWSQWFTVLDIFETRVKPYQDMVALRRK